MRSVWPPLAFLFALNQPLSVTSRAAAGFAPFPRQTSGTPGVGIQVGSGNCAVAGSAQFLPELLVSSGRVGSGSCFLNLELISRKGCGILTADDVVWAPSSAAAWAASSYMNVFIQLCRLWCAGSTRCPVSQLVVSWNISTCYITKSVEVTTGFFHVWPPHYLGFDPKGWLWIAGKQPWAASWWLCPYSSVLGKRRPSSAHLILCGTVQSSTAT